MNETLEEIKLKHINNYKSAILENIKNNTNVLIDEDIMSLLKKPPLDSMDLIKSRFLDLAKKNKIVLNTEMLNLVMDKYRKDLSGVCDILKKIRLDGLCEKLDSFKVEKDSDIFKLVKKDFFTINKEIKKNVKEYVDRYTKKDILDEVNSLFVDGVDIKIREKIVGEATKFINSNYQRQLIENIEFKILVKDTILLNGIKEQNERYLFTLNNSRIFSDL